MMYASSVAASPLDFLQGWDSFQKAAAEAAIQREELMAKAAGTLTGAGATSLNPDVSARTNLGVYQFESVEKSFSKTVLTAKDLKLVNKLGTTNATQLLHLWRVQTDIGGQPMGVFQDEMGEIEFDLSQERKGQVILKFLITGVDTSRFVGLTDTSPDYDAEQDVSAQMRLARGLNMSGYYGAERFSEYQFDGIAEQLRKFAPANIRHLDGLSDINVLHKDVVYGIGAQVKQLYNHGRLTDLMIDEYVQADFNASLLPQYRVMASNNPASVVLGAHVPRVGLAEGEISLENDIMVRNCENTKPIQALTKRTPPASYPLAPTSVSATPVAPTVAGSKITAGRAGVITLRAAGVDARGREGALSAAFTGTVAANGALTLAATPGAGGVTHSIRFYASRKDQGDTVAGSTTTGDDLRLLVEVATNPLDRNAAVSYQWKGVEIAGASDIFALRAEKEALSYVKLGDVLKLPLYPTNTATNRRAMAMVRAICARIPQHHFVLKGYVPASATWKMFG